MRRLLLPGALLMLIAATGLTMAFCGNTPSTPSELHTFDSLKVTAPIYHAVRDTLVLRETTYVTRAVRAEHAGAAARAEADSAKARADSLETAAQTSADSATLWRLTAETREVEATKLRHANDSLSSAWTQEHLARLQADARAALDSTRNVALDDLNDRLAAKLRKESNRPSSAKVFVAGVLTGTLAVAVATR